MLPESHPLCQTEWFLRLWFDGTPQDQYVEFRAFLDKEDPRCKDKSFHARTLVQACRIGNFEKSFDEAIAPWIQRADSQKYHVCFGVCPRTFVERSDSGHVHAAKREHITHAVGAWIDIDSAQWQRQAEELKSMATFIVASGHGCHAYFKYPSVVPIEQAERDSKRLAGAYGGDETFDAPRVFRLPGTRNWKGWTKNIEPVSCSLYHVDPDCKYSSSSDSLTGSSKTGDVSALQWDLRDLIMTGYDAASSVMQETTPLKEDGSVNRSAVDHYVMVRLFVLGWSEEEIAQVFKNSEYGISGKYFEEEHNGDHYLDISLRKAAASADVEKSSFGIIGPELAIERIDKLMKAPPLTFCVDQVLPAGGLFIVSGPAKSGKSLVVSDLILLLAGVEGKFLDRFSVNTPGPVLYCQAEISRSSLKKRLCTIGASRNILAEDYPIYVFTGRFDLNRNDHRKVLTESLSKNKIKYLVVDPLARFHSGNENHQSDMASVLSGMERCGKEAGCLGTVLVHHHGKPQEGSDRVGVQKIRGASVIGDWGNSHLIMNKQFSDTTGRKFVRMVFELRDADEPDPFSVMLDPEKLRFVDFSEEEERLAVAMGVIENIPEGMDHKAVVADVADRIGSTKTEAERLIQKAKVQQKFGGNGHTVTPRVETGPEGIVS